MAERVGQGGGQSVGRVGAHRRQVAAQNGGDHARHLLLARVSVPRDRLLDARRRVPVHRDARLAQDMAKDMLDEGIYVIGFSFPVVPKGQARIRVQLSAAHTREHVDRAIEAFTKIGKMHGVIS